MDTREEIFRGTSFYLCMEAKDNAPDPICKEDRELSEGMAEMLRVLGLSIFEQEIPARILVKDIDQVLESRKLVQNNKDFQRGSSAFYYDVLGLVKAILEKLSYYLEE